MEVGCPKQSQEENPGPSRYPPNFEGQGHEGIRDHWRLPCEEGGAADGARASPAPDGARGVVQRDGACRRSAPSLIKEAMEPSKDTAGVVLDFVFPVPEHPPMRPEPGFIDFVSFLSP